MQEKINSLQSLDKKKLFLTNFPYLICGHFTDKIAWLYRVSDGATGWDKLMETLNYFERALQTRFPACITWICFMDLPWCGNKTDCILQIKECQEVPAVY